MKLIRLQDNIYNADHVAAMYRNNKSIIVRVAGSVTSDCIEYNSCDEASKAFEATWVSICLKGE